MDARQRRNTVARAILLWLHEEGDSYPLVDDFLGRSGAQVDDEQVGNDELVRTVRWLHDRGLVEGPLVEEVPYPVRLSLTRSGSRCVVERDGWVEPDAAPTGSDSKPSVAAVARGFLLWLYDNDSQHPMPTKFLDDPRSTIDGQAVGEALMTEAVRLLVAKGLVSGRGSWGSDIPVRIRLSDAGRICVVDRDGDIRPQATFADLERGGPTVDKSITTTGQGNTVVAHSDNVTLPADSSQEPDLVVDLGVATESGYVINVKMIAGPQQLHVTLDVAVLDPQEGVTASLENGERRRMVRDFSRTVTATVEPPMADHSVAIEIIAICEDVDVPEQRWTMRRALTIHGGPWIV